MSPGALSGVLLPQQAGCGSFLCSEAPCSRQLIQEKLQEGQTAVFSMGIGRELT